MLPGLTYTMQTTSIGSKSRKSEYEDRWNFFLRAVLVVSCMEPRARRGFGKNDTSVACDPGRTCTFHGLRWTDSPGLRTGNDELFERGHRGGGGRGGGRRRDSGDPGHRCCCRAPAARRYARTVRNACQKHPFAAFSSPYAGTRRQGSY